jgi:2-polyprenyl-3-methyl-5-hydroxy-6-metoxy-1,4-benzoquinol methylase
VTKQAERAYAERVDQVHLYRKPFDTPRVLREFALVLDVFRSALPPGGAVLDLGCGSGWTSLFLARAGYEVTGLDISERMIAIARERAQQEQLNTTFITADMEAFELERRDFDGVLLFDSLHHCPDYSRVLRQAGTHLREGGYLLLMEPSWLHRYSPHARATERRYGVTELGFTRHQLHRELRRAGFRRPLPFHDAGQGYRGLAGFLLANLRLWCDFWCCFPQMKQVVLAQK